MIKALTIKNIQSHKGTEITFDPGVNIIVGPSDSGKTAILRALRWLIRNQPSGDVLRSNWGGESVVHIETDTDRIDRWKHNYENAYRLNTTTFEAIRTDVPQEVNEALNMGEVNLQRQLDSPFLISETAGDVAKHFNRVARLDKIDTGLQNVNRWITQIVKILEFKRGEKDRYTEQLKQYDHLEKFEASVEVLEALEQRRNTLVRNVATIKRLLTSYQQVEKDITDLTESIKEESKIDSILDLYDDRKSFEEKINGINSILDSIEESNTELNQLNKLVKLEGQVGTILKLYEEQEVLVKDNTRLLRTIESINRINTLTAQEQVKQGRMQKEFDLNMPEVCPLCGTKLK